jgi:hypothetical protein
MKKILLVCDGMQFSEGAFHFAKELNRLQPLMLIGVFMPQVSYAHLWSYTNALGGPAVLPLTDASEKEVVQKNINHFETLCKKHNIAYQVHKDYVDFALPELKKETRFADLLLLSSERFYHNILGNDDIDYIAEVIHEAECPVMVVPEKFDFPARNVIAYDGSASSLHAIKQFTYLFPELCRKETTVLYLHRQAEAALPHESELKDLVEQHFPQAVYFETGYDIKKQFSQWLLEKGPALLIAGSFGRSALSQMFKKSFLRDVMAAHQLPVFIAHK